MDREEEEVGNENVQEEERVGRGMGGWGDGGETVTRFETNSNER